MKLLIVVVAITTLAGCAVGLYGELGSARVHSSAPPPKPTPAPSPSPSPTPTPEVSL